MTRQQIGLAASAAIFLTVITVQQLGLSGAFVALGITGLLYAASWAFYQVVAEALITIDGAKTVIVDATDEFRDWVADMEALPEPEWADRTPIESRRLRSVPLQRRAGEGS